MLTHIGPEVLPAYLQISERLVLGLAALATLAAVLIAIRALRESDKTARTLNDSLALARAAQEKRDRERAALVLPRIDLLQARLNSVWRDGLAYDEVHRTLDIIAYYLRVPDRRWGARVGAFWGLQRHHVTMLLFKTHH